MKLSRFSDQSPPSLLLPTLLLALFVAAGSPCALGQAHAGARQQPRRILPSALEMPCYLWAVDAEDIPFFDARWFIGSGNSIQVRIKGNFACSAMPSVSDQNGVVKGRCTRTKETTEAVYLDPRLLFGETDVHVGFYEIGVGVLYHLNFEEFGAPLYVVGY